MTNEELISKIREEIERRIHEISHPLKDGYEIQSIGKIEGLSELLDFLSTLESEKPVPSDLDFEQELYNRFGQVKDFTLGTDVNVYLVTTSDATNFPITEASVAESLAELSTGTRKITCTPKNADATTSFTATPAKVTTVPAEDGTTKTINALKLTGAAATTATTALVVEYIKTPATYNTETVAIADQDALNAALATGKLYTNSAGTIEASATFDGEATYYRRTSVNSVGVYAYKVIRVVAP